MKMWKITLFVVNLNEEFKNAEECIEHIDFDDHVHIFRSEYEEADIGEWDDESILNYKDTPIEEFEKYFEGDPD